MNTSGHFNSNVVFFNKVFKYSDSFAAILGKRTEIVHFSRPAKMALKNLWTMLNRLWRPSVPI